MVQAVLLLLNTNQVLSEEIQRLTLDFLNVLILDSPGDAIAVFNKLTTKLSPEQLCPVAASIMDRCQHTQEGNLLLKLAQMSLQLLEKQGMDAQYSSLKISWLITELQSVDLNQALKLFKVLAKGKPQSLPEEIIFSLADELAKQGRYREAIDLCIPLIKFSNNVAALDRLVVWDMLQPGCVNLEIMLKVFQEGLQPELQRKISVMVSRELSKQKSTLASSLSQLLMQKKELLIKSLYSSDLQEAVSINTPLCDLMIALDRNHIDVFEIIDQLHLWVIWLLLLQFRY